MRTIFAAIAFSFALSAGPTQLVGNQGSDATYMAGNLDEISAGTDGKLLLAEDKATFSAGKTEISTAYKQFKSVELGDPIEQKRKGFHISKKPTLARRQVTIVYADPQAKLDRTMTLEMDDEDAQITVEQLELHMGKRKRNTNGDSWWGDSAWKTKRNSEVKPDALGTVGGK